MAVVTVEVVEAMMDRMMAKSMEMMTKLIGAKESGGSTDKMKMGHGGKIPEFHGKEEKYAEWIVKLVAYFKVHMEKSEKYMEIAMNSDKEQNDGEFGIQGSGEWNDEEEGEVKRFSSTIYSVLINHTTDDAFKICNSVKSCQGLEALRLLKRRYDPKSPGTKRAILKGLMIMMPAKKLSELEGTILKFEEMVKKYETMSKIELPEDLIIISLIDLCSKELKSHLELSSKSMTKQDIRDEIFSYIERTRNAVKDNFASIESEGIHSFDNYNYESWENDMYPYEYADQSNEQVEELHYFGGKNGGKGFGGKSYGKGFQWEPKGKGKTGFKGGYSSGAPKGGYSSGKGFGSDGKGGKGKAKGGFQGDCFWCGKYGHSQRDCPDKDAYMSWVRKGKGKGVDDVNNVEEKPEFNLEKMENGNPNKCHQLCGSLETYEAGARFRPLNSLLSVNRWSILTDDDDEAEDQDADEPPGLVEFRSIVKKKMHRVKKWTPVNECGTRVQGRGKIKTVSKVKDASKYCCWPSGQGCPATWDILGADGFKSSGICKRNEADFMEENGKESNDIGDEIKRNETRREISNIEELIGLYNFENEDGDYGGPAEYIDFTVDSGAADTVANGDVAPTCKTVSSEGSRNGVKYVAAAGKVISNEGEKNVKTQTEEGHLCAIKIQIAQVNKALLSVSKICDAGHEVTFNKDGGQIVHQSTGQVVKFRRVAGVYRLRVKIMQDVGSGFPRPGM